MFAVGAAIIAAASIFPLAISGNGLYAVTQQGTPFLVNGDAAYSLIAQLSGSALTQYLDAMQALGVNALLINLFEHKFSNNAPANALGVAPFSTPEDIRTVQSSYFNHVRTVIRAAAARGMVVFLVHAYSGFNGGDEGWWSAISARTTGECTTFGQFIGNELRSEPNIIWVQGGDYSDPSTTSRVNAIMNGILSQAPASTLCTYHTAPSSDSRSVASLANLSINSVYVYDTTGAPSNDTGRPGFLFARSTTPAMPAVNYEPRYEGFASSVEWIDEQRYGAILSGLFGSIPGAEVRWHFDTPAPPAFISGSWVASLTSNMTVRYPYLRQAFEGRRWHDLVPDTGSALITAGRGTPGADGYVTAALTPDGKYGFAYVPGGGAITVARSAMSGLITARWFDPTNGTYQTQSGSPFTNVGSSSMQATGNNSQGGTGRLLVLEAP